MDPLSTTASIIALLGLVKSLKSLLSSIKNAPLEFRDISNELEKTQWLASRLDACLQTSLINDADVVSRLERLEIEVQKIHISIDKLGNNLPATQGRKMFSFRATKLALRRTQINQLKYQLSTLQAHMRDLLLVLVLQNSTTEQVPSFIIALNRRLLALELQQQHVPANCATLEHDAAIVVDKPSRITWTKDIDYTRVTEVEVTDQPGDCGSEITRLAVQRNCDSPDQFYTPNVCRTPLHVAEESLISPEVFDSRVCLLSTTTKSSRVQVLHILFQETPRTWKRISLLVEYAALPENELCTVDTDNYATMACPTLPAVMMRKLGLLLTKEELSASTMHAKVTIGQNGNEIGFSTMSIAGICQVYFEASLHAPILQRIYHMDLSRCSENEVAVVWWLSTYVYLAVYRGQLCGQRVMPLADDFLGSEHVAAFERDLFWTVRAGRNGGSGCSKFVSAVVHANGTPQACVKSYLFQIGELGTLNGIQRQAMLQDPDASLRRRLNWIHDLVTTVAKLHEADIVAGCIYPRNVSIDANDHAILARDILTHRLWRNRGGLLPPELRNSVGENGFLDPQLLNFASDIFQLGITIWLIANNLISIWQVFTDCVTRSTPPHAQWFDQHNNPTELAPCSSAPAYITELVSLCRKRDPNERARAKDLLDLLVRHRGPRKEESRLNSGPIIQPPQYSNHWEQITWCDDCGVDATDLSYSCRICNAGDHNVCPRCYNEGLRCPHGQHTMHRMTHKDGSTIIEP